MYHRLKKQKNTIYKIYGSWFQLILDTRLILTSWLLACRLESQGPQQCIQFGWKPTSSCCACFLWSVKSLALESWNLKRKEFWHDSIWSNDKNYVPHGNIGHRAPPFPRETRGHGLRTVVAAHAPSAQSLKASRSLREFCSTYFTLIVIVMPESLYKFTYYTDWYLLFEICLYTVYIQVPGTHSTHYTFTTILFDIHCFTATTAKYMHWHCKTCCQYASMSATLFAEVGTVSWTPRQQISQAVEGLNQSLQPQECSGKWFNRSSQACLQKHQFKQHEITSHELNLA